MQHRLNLCIKTRQNVHPRALVAFVIETMSDIIQYYRTIAKVWDSLYSKHQLQDSDITLDRVYNMLSEFLIELKLNEEQKKITQIVTGASRKVRAEGEKEVSRTGVYRATTTVSPKAASMVTIVQDIIPDDNQEDVQL